MVITLLIIAYFIILFFFSRFFGFIKDSDDSIKFTNDELYSENNNSRV